MLTHLVDPFYVPTPVVITNGTLGTNVGTETMPDAAIRLKVDSTIEDRYNHYGEFSQVRDLRTCEPFRLVGVPFEGTTIDSNFWTSTVSGAGAANTQASGLITAASGTANSGYAQLQSVRKARFVFAHPHVCRQVVRIPTVVVAQNTRRWGAYTVTAAPAPSDGFYFELSAAGALSVNAINTGGTPTSVPSGSFNGNVASYTVNTNVHAYEIHYYVMGVEFYVDGTLLHTMLPTTANLSALYTLNASFASVNSASGTTSGTIEAWACTIARLGREQTNPTTYTHANGQTAGVTLKRGAGVVNGMSIGQATNNAVIILYDNVSAAVPILGTWVVPNNSIIPVNMTGLSMPFYTGLTLAVTTQNAGLTIMYE